MVMLLECNNDVNETTSRLIDSKYLVPSPLLQCSTACKINPEDNISLLCCRPVQPGLQQKAEKEAGASAHCCFWFPLFFRKMQTSQCGLL
jgi:hypothetical protein